MTQPAPPAQGNTGQVIAAAAIGLALIALEARVRQQVDETIQAAFTTIAATAVLVAAAPPAVVITGIALLSLPALHAAITANLDKARTAVTITVEAGYTGAAQIAFAQLRTDLDGLPATLPPLGDNLDRIVADITTMFGHAQTDLQSGIAGAYDGIHGPNADAARTIAINQATLDARNRLRQRALAAAAAAVHTGSSDTQQALFDHFQNTTGIPGLMKRWVVTASDPCGMCEALNGTMVGVNAEFDHNATTNPADLRRVWRNLLAPPRHPNCRCQLELVTTP